MTPPSSIHHVRLPFADNPSGLYTLQIDDGCIAGISRSHEGMADAGFDGGGRMLTPGLVDLHTHGLHRFMYENGPEEVLQIAELLPGYGTTCVLPTLIPRPGDAFLRLLSRIADVLPSVTRVKMPGLHLEGPFVALTGAACKPRPGDLAHLEELLAAADGRVLAVSISPEVPGILPVIRYLHERGIAVFMTHTGTSAEETEAAIEAGARHATHFYDVFPIPPERERGVRQVGAIEAILADARVSVDFIADGCHVPPVAIRAALAAKGCERVGMITDSNIGAGLPEGIYPTPWGYPVKVSQGDAARIQQPGHPLHGCLAGSALTMDQGVRNLLRWLPIPTAEVWQMATSTPARIAGLTTTGTLSPGSDADLVLWNDDLSVACTWVSGRLVHQAKIGCKHEPIHL